MFRLNLSNRHVSDEDLIHIGKMVGLEELDLSEHRITDKGMVHLAGLKNLKLLRLPVWEGSIAKITDTGLGHLTGLRKLKSLFLGNTLITAAGIETLEQFPSLEHLDITGTSMKDADQLDFRKIRGLKRLVAYEFDERKILLPDGCYITTFE